MAEGFAEFLDDLFRPIGRVQMRRMFGGQGVFRDGLMFALVTGDVLYFKSDDETRPAFEAEGCSAFGYDTKTGRRVLTSYWRAPERLLDDPEAFVAWAEAAMAVARRAEAAKAAGGKKAGAGAKTARAAG